MKFGTMWFDNSKDDFTAKCWKAISFYRAKFKMTPQVIVVNPSTFIVPIAGIRFESNRSVLPNHFWLGMEDFSE